MSTAKFIWDDFPNIIIRQPMLWQRKDRCSFTSTARALEYDIRLMYAKRDPPYQVPCKQLIDQEQWEDQLVEAFPDHVGSWKPLQLLEQASGMDHQNPHREERIGCPTSNGAIHYINEHAHIDMRKGDAVDKIKRLLARRIPVIAVVVILDDFPKSADKPYIGLKNLLPTCTTRNSYHAVVLVGEYVAGEGDVYQLELGSYFLYQTSRTKGKEGKICDSLFGDGIGILHPRVIKEANYGLTYPPSILATPREAELIRGQELRVQARKKNDFQARKKEKEEQASGKRVRP